MLGLGLGIGAGGVPPLARYAVGWVLPSAVMDFETGFLSGVLSFTRASTATYVDADGTLKTAAIDAPRFDWSTGRRALLLEGSTTNFATRSSHTAAYPWNTSNTHNGVTATMVASGYIGDVPYADYALTGTASSSASTPVIVSSTWASVAAGVGETWTCSVSHMLIAGAWPAGVLVGGRVSEFDASSAFISATIGGSVPSAVASRGSATRTLNQANLATVRGAITISGLTAGVTTFTGQVIRLFGWQLEPGAAPTSLIQTLGGVAVTRAADAAQIAALAAGTYDRRRGTSTGTVDTKAIVHPGGAVSIAEGLVHSVAYYPGGTLP